MNDQTNPFLALDCIFLVEHESAMQFLFELLLRPGDSEPAASSVASDFPNCGFRFEHNRHQTSLSPGIFVLLWFLQSMRNFLGF